SCLFYFFFFQAEDGIRDRNVTGVQTCALPIFNMLAKDCEKKSDAITENDAAYLRGLYRMDADKNPGTQRDEVAYRMEQELKGRRSEERRVGKECRSRGGTDEEKKKERKIRVRE